MYSGRITAALGVAERFFFERITARGTVMTMIMMTATAISIAQNHRLLRHDARRLVFSFMSAVKGNKWYNEALKAA